MTDITDNDRDEELYRGKGRVWIEAGTELGVSRGALLEAGVGGSIDVDPPHVDEGEPIAAGAPIEVNGFAWNSRTGFDDVKPLGGPPPRTADRYAARTLDGGIGGDAMAQPQRMPDFICRRSTSALDVRPPLKPRTREEEGMLDESKLILLLAQGDLKPDTRRAFEEMRASLDRFPSLTDRQRSWVNGVLDEQGLDVRSPAEKNANVPRGREVATPAVLKQLPLAPPGRKPLVEVPPLDIDLTETGMHLLQNSEQRGAMIDAAVKESKQKGRVMRFVGPAGEEIGRVDGDVITWFAPMPMVAQEQPKAAPLPPPAPAAVTKARSASIGVGASGIPTKLASAKRRRSALATDD